MKAEDIVEKYKESFELCTDFSVPTPWLPIVDKLTGIISCRRKRLGIEPVQITQIKDKFGGLNYYCVGTDDVEDRWIRKAEHICRNTCEVCGTKTKVELHKIRSWLWTLCDKCHIEKRAELKLDNFEEN